MEIRELKTFRTVASLSSFNKAATVLHYAQSTISEHIKSLENGLKVKLFNRLGKQISLTKAGEVLLKYAQKILEIEDELKMKVVDINEQYGTISIKIPQTLSTYFLPPLLNEFHHQYPKVSININSCSYYSLEQELESGIIQLAFLILDTYKAPHLKTEILSSLPLVIAVKPGHPLLKKSKVREHDIKGETILLAKGDCSYRMLLERRLTEKNVKPGPIININSIESIKRSAIKGTGIAFLPKITIKRELDSGLLYVLPWYDENLSANVIMIWHENKWISPVLETFMNKIRDLFN